MDKDVLRGAIVNCLVSHGLIRAGLEQRKTMGMSALENFMAEFDWHQSFGQLMEMILQAIERVEAAGR